MARMTHEYSHFPDSYYELHEFKDANNQIGVLIGNIKKAQASKNYVDAQRLIESNKKELSQYLLTTEVINAMEEELRNLEIYAKQIKQQIYYQNEEPSTESVGDVWIG